MTLQAGKRYVRRDGTVTPQLTAHGQILRDPEKKWFYDNEYDGHKVLLNFKGNHPHDLIAKYVSPVVTPPIIPRLEAIQKMADEAAVKYTPYQESELSELYHAVTALICDVQEGKV